MGRIFWDSNIFVHLFEDFGAESALVASMRERMLERGDRLLTSTLTLGEVTVKAKREGQIELARRYEDAIVATAEVIAFDVGAARLYASIRADTGRNVRPADAIQMACAAAAGTDVFVTNDKKLHQVRIAGIQFTTSVDRVPI